MAEGLVSSGAVLIVADAGINEVNQNKEFYKNAGEFLRAFVDYGDDKALAVYGSDLTSRWDGHTQIICKANEMATADWLKPIYAEVPEIFVNHPVNLISWESIAASGNRNTTFLLHYDTPTDKIYCPFASVAKLGHGYVVFIAAEVSFDLILDLSPNNTKWLISTATFLLNPLRNSVE